MISYSTPAKFHCGCQKIKQVFKVLGMYRFGSNKQLCTLFCTAILTAMARIALKPENETLPSAN